jgi:hypothetical protein
MQSQMSNSQMTMQGPYGSNMMGMAGSMIQPSMGYAPSMAVRTPSLISAVCDLLLHMHASCACTHEAYLVYHRYKCTNMRISRFALHPCLTPSGFNPQLCSRRTWYLRFCIVAVFCVCNSAARTAAEGRVSCMQSHSQYASSFYPAYDAQSDVASSVNGHNGGMHMPGGYAPGYGQPQFPPGYVQPQFGPQYGQPHFRHPSTEGWTSPGHNVHGQVQPPHYTLTAGMHTASVPLCVDCAWTCFSDTCDSVPEKLHNVLEMRVVLTARCADAASASAPCLHVCARLCSEAPQADLAGRMQVILEEGGSDFGQAADYGANEFSFPGVQEQEMQESYGEMDQMHEGPVEPSSVSHGHNAAFLHNSAVPTSPRSQAGLTNPLSTGTGPSQSLTGLLAGANDLLGEMGTTQTTALTGTIPGAPGSRTTSFRQQKPPDGH